MKKIISSALVFFLLLTLTPKMVAAEEQPSGITPVTITYNAEGLLDLFKLSATPAESAAQEIIAEYSYKQYTDDFGDVNVDLNLTLRYGDESITLHPTGHIVHSNRTENLGVWSGPLEAEFDLRGETYFAMIGFNKFDGIDGVHFTASITPPDDSDSESTSFEFGDDIATDEVVKETKKAIDSAKENRRNNRDTVSSVPNAYTPTGLLFWLAMCGMATAVLTHS